VSRRPRPATLLGLALLSGAFLGLVGMGLTSALVYYQTPTELASVPVGRAVRLYGIVASGSVRWDAGTKTLRFAVTDGTTTFDVTTQNVPTALFREGIGVVLEGRKNGRRSFLADAILVKHSSVYEPLRPGETVPPGVLQQILAGKEASP